MQSEDDDEDLPTTFSKLTRKQQKSFALEAAVQLLAESRVSRVGSVSLGHPSFVLGGGVYHVTCIVYRVILDGNFHEEFMPGSRFGDSCVV